MLSVCLRIRIRLLKKIKVPVALWQKGQWLFGSAASCLGTAYERRSPYLSFRCLYTSPIRKRYQFTAGSTDFLFQPRDGIELATFSTAVQRCNPLDHRDVACNPVNLQSGSRLTIIPTFKEDLSFKVANYFFSLKLRVYCSYDHVKIVILNKILT